MPNFLLVTFLSACFNVGMYLVRGVESDGTAAALTSAVFLAILVYKVLFTRPDPPASPPIAKGKTRICVTGYTFSPPTANAHYLADKLVSLQRDKYETWYYFDNFAWGAFTLDKFASVKFPPELKGHSTSPFVWLESGDDKRITPIGGFAEFGVWAKKNCDHPIIKEAADAPYGFVTALHTLRGALATTDTTMA